MENFVELLKQDIQKVSDSNPFKSLLQLNYQSIELFENQKKNNDQVKNVISIRLLSDEYESGQIGLKPLSDALNSFENIQANGIASAMGFDNKRGKIPKELLDRNELIITATRAGSFIIDMGLKNTQLSMFEEENQISLNVISDVSELLGEEIEVPEFVEKYNSRTFESVKKMISGLNKEKIGIEITNALKAESYLFSKENIKDINTKFKNTHIENKDGIELTGILTKVDLMTQKITLDVEGEYITIKVNDKNIKDLHLTTNEYYKVSTSVKEIVRKTDRKRTYVTNSIKNITTI